MVRTFGRSDSISFCRARAFVCNSGSVSGAQENRPPDRRVSLPERETLFFGGWPDCGVCVGSIRPRSRCSGFAITVRGVCGRGIAAVSDAVYSRAAIRSGCNRRFFIPVRILKIARSAVLLRRALAGEAGFGVWSCRAGGAMRMIPGFGLRDCPSDVGRENERMKPGKFCKSRRIC